MNNISSSSSSSSSSINKQRILNRDNQLELEIMSESASGGIRYVPKHKRRGGGGRPERLHGAFSGGFSAGYFNTVGSREGFQPRQKKPTETIAGVAATEEEEEEPHQKLEDFMDEHDHNEWGGPRNVRQDLVGRTLATDSKKDAGAVVNSASLLTETVFASDLIPSKNVGSRLLQKLGWREGSSTAFVPGGAENSKQQSARQHPDDINDNEETQFLSQRRLKKIRVQQERITIPRPKLDQVGLGFEAYANAPEFQAFREKRRRLAQERARGDHRSIYRISNVLGNNGSDDDDTAGVGAAAASTAKKGDDREHNYESYEVMEDFVGSRTVGGFALHDDEDDAFDDARTLTKVSDKILLDKEEYNTVIEDPHSDDDDNHDHYGQKMGAGGAHNEDLAKGFMAWTDATSIAGRAEDSKPSVSLTTDGRPPLAGFILGSSGGVLKRFRGPDIPDSYQIEKHVFRDDEHPLVWKTLARAVQLENDAARRESAVKDALEMNRIQKKVPPPPTRSDNNAPMAGDAFATLANAMKNRFTTGKSDNIEDRNSKKLAPGLTHASVLTEKTDKPEDSTKVVSQRNLSVKRTVQSFAPASLLCKRWRIRAPTLNSNAVVPKEASQPSKEEVFFQNEVMAAARNVKINSPSNAAQKDYEEPIENDIRANRPSMDVYKSIFGAVDSEDEENDDGTEGDNDKAQQTMSRGEGAEKSNSEKANGYVEANPADKTSAIENEPTRGKHEYTWSSDSSVDKSEENNQNKKSSSKGRVKEKKKKKEHRKKKKKHRKRDRSDDEHDDDSANDASDKKSKRRKHRRKEERKKKDKSKRKSSRDVDKAEEEESSS